MTYTYDYPHPALAADIALLTARSGRLSILLVRRGNPPFDGCWALPGGFMDIDETLLDCAARELEEETGVTGIKLSPVAVFDGVRRDPRERVVSAVHAGLIRADAARPRGGSDARSAQWFYLSELPELAFDHARIIDEVQRWLRCHGDILGLALAMLPMEFDREDLVRLYAELTG
jgi:8-oxo-dGTP diphosphatase